MTCGVFGNVTVDDVRATTDGTDFRTLIRVWVQEAGFREVAFHGEPSPYGVGVATLAVEPEPFRRGVAMFRFR
jgi:hypothetical protein